MAPADGTPDPSGRGHAPGGIRLLGAGLLGAGLVAGRLLGRRGTADREGPAPSITYRPEPAPPGWRTGPPDFVGVGAPGSGWAWWNDLIHAHPAVAQPAGRAAGFHVFDGAWSRTWADADTERYHALFPRPEGAIAGEWSPDYIVDFWAAPLLRRAAPEARLLVMLRDPVERFRAGIGDLGEPTRPAWSPRATAGAGFQCGLYADQLRRLWACFPRDRVLVLQYERCLADPATELRRTFDFLRIDRAAADQILTGRPAPEDSAGLTLREDQRRTLARAYAPENRRLAALIADLDLSLWASA